MEGSFILARLAGLVSCSAEILSDVLLGVAITNAFSIFARFATSEVLGLFRRVKRKQKHKNDSQSSPQMY